MITKELSDSQLSDSEIEDREKPLASDSNGNGFDSSEQGLSLDQKEVKAILEALLFVAQDPLTAEKLTEVIGAPSRSQVYQTLKALQMDYNQEGRGLQVAEVAGGFVMVTRPDCSPWIKRLKKAKPAPKLSRSALETLAIISYKQPIVRADIEKLRGVETSGVLRTLLEHKLVRIVGRQDVPGRPILYGTSKHFLQRFGLRDLRDLPPLREIKELGTSDMPSLFLNGEQSQDDSDGTAADLTA